MPVGDKEILSCSKFYVEFDGITDLIIRNVTGIATNLDVAGAEVALGVTKGGKAVIQATVTGVTNSRIRVEFAIQNGDRRLETWYSSSHSESFAGGGSGNKGALKNGSIILYNQGGEEAARWNLTNIMPVSYQGPPLSADAAAIATETLEFEYQTLHRVT